MGKSSNSAHEFELKLEFDRDGFDRLCVALSEKGLLPGTGTELITTYYDTPGLELRKAGISLRLRTGGGPPVQTVKMRTGMRGGISNPFESEGPVAGEIPDLDAIPSKAVRKRVESILDGSAPEPVVRTDITRIHLPPDCFDGVADLSLDRGTVSAGGREEHFNEAELELAEGTANELLALALDLFRDKAWRFSNSTKAERGYRLLENGPEFEAVPERASPAQLRPGARLNRGFAIMAASAVDQILSNWEAVLVNDDPECAHQLRIGLRRLRTVLKMVRPVIDTPELRALEAELRDAGRLVGRLRDADVILIDIAAPALAFFNDTDAATALDAILARDRVEERATVREGLREQRWNEMLLRLALLPYGAGWQGTIGDDVPRLKTFAPEALQHAWKTVRKEARRLAELTVAERHQLRKHLKTLRYRCEAFQSLFPAGRYDEFLLALKTLQDKFGYLNDVELARSMAARLPEDADVRAAAGFVLGWHAALLEHEWADVTARWDSLNATRPFWDAKD